MVRWSALCIVIVILSPTFARDSEAPKSPESNKNTNTTNAQSEDLQAYAENSTLLEAPNLPSKVDQNSGGNSEQRTNDEAQWISIDLQKEDLKTQQSMAQSAKVALIVAWIQLFASLVGIVILVLTLWGTLRATKAAEKAAKAAMVSAKAARDVLLCDRAWVSTANGNVGPMKIGERFYCAIDFTNSGKTPALNLRVRHLLGWGSPSVDIKQMTLLCEDESQYPPASMGPLGPNVSCHTEGPTPDIVSQEIADEITRGDKVVYAFGMVRYDDTCGTGILHMTRYCYAVDPVSWKLRTYGKYNDMT